MSFFAAPDGTQLHEMIWDPSGPPSGTVALVHGYGEHIGRYDWTARALGASGWRVHGFDLRGHGRSAGARGYIARFDEYLDDLGAVLERARPAAPAPLFLLGHSLGGLIATAFVLDRQARVDGLILSSPFFRLKLAVSPLKLAAGRLASRLWPGLRLPTGLRGTDVTRDPELQADFERDPLNNKHGTARWFTEATRMQDEVLARAREITLPCLFMQAGADRVADPRGTEEVFARLGSSDRTLKLYADQYHELFNEPPADREKTIAELAAWLDAHRAARAAAGST
jgi:alpha-beta hydrolase superfamily lysophospholipase